MLPCSTVSSQGIESHYLGMGGAINVLVSSVNAWFMIVFVSCDMQHCTNEFGHVWYVCVDSYEHALLIPALPSAVVVGCIR